MLRLAAHDTIYLDFLYHHAPVEEIFHMESHMKDNNPSKLYIHMLLSFTEAIMSVFDRVELSDQFVRVSYQSLLDAMNMWRYVVVIDYFFKSNAHCVH